MAVKLWSNKIEQFCDSTGVPRAGAKLFTYVGGSVNTKQTTYTESTGVTANTNPIVLDSNGKIPQPIWLTTGVSYKFVLAPSTDTDPPTSPIDTIDVVTGINDSSSSQSEWIAGPTPTFVSGTQFTLVGDQTTNFSKKRRLKFTVTAGTVYGEITASAFGASTAVTVALDSGALDSGLSAVSYSVISSTNPSIDADMIYRKGTAVASAATTDIWSIVGDYVHVTGSTPITSFGTAPYAGGRRLIIHDGSLTITNGANLKCPDNLDLTVYANDVYEVVADTTTAHRIVKLTRANGLIYNNPNLLINPNWLIDQINEGALYTVTGGGANVQGPDAWTGVAVAAPGVFKLRTLADPDNAALKCLEITCTTIDAAIGAADDYHIETAIEGYDAASLQAGLASAQPITVQFKFKTSVVGVYGVSIANSAKTRSYVGIITVANANENEYSLSLTMDATGAWLYTNGVGLYLRLTLAAGANFQAAAGAWNAANNLTTAAQCNFMSNIANIAYLKRIQLIPGALVQAYRPADIRLELAKAQRYYAKTYDQGVIPGAVSASGKKFARAHTNLFVWWNWDFRTTMRAAPTMQLYSPATGTAGSVRNESSGADVGSFAWSPGADSAYIDGSGGLAVSGNIGTVHGTANARLS